MTDKERLEKIKQDVKMTRRDLAVSPSNEITLHMDIMLNSMDYLIEQAERVQELEEHLEKNRDYLYKCNLLNERLEKQNERYREALERIKDNVPLEFEHKSEYEAKKNVIRLMNIQKEVDEALLSD